MRRRRPIATERGRLLDALGAFTDPKLVQQALALMLTDEFDLREGSGMLQGAMSGPRTRMTRTVREAALRRDLEQAAADLSPVHGVTSQRGSATTR